ncbi:helix-turn-helix domain-containing protein [Streptomyces lancefieldiae]|uniref:Helix-turn-helix transcriptional regulator n=1 Tax=Streptomyces lancefieldiae TaxID=3075520 RepID=A0ABU3AL63_9ACTN|nr:helix-turn-helix transcriptional regulator [Streptomyces sp. DSM 40712]MDT0610926.1 helix-turn-helix transcriptional regulator [Streptomyces sp. DSM 40712]
MSSGSAEAAEAAWAEFGRQLRSRRRAAGLTQLQLGLRVGYHHSLVSRLEAGLREPPVGLVRRLDAVLETGGELAAVVAAPREVPHRPGRLGVDPALFTPLPGADATAGRGTWDPRLWPARLPAEGLACPLHGNAGCAVPDQGELPALLEGPRPLGGPAGPRGRSTGAADAEPELLHALTAVLACLIREAFRHEGPVTAVEGLLRDVTRWAEAVNSTGRLPYGQLRLAAQYAQVAGRLRMERGQSGVAMAWFGHGLRWADAVEDAPARATLLSDMCTLVRLDGDAATMVGYARGIGEVDGKRRWTATLSALYQARGHALAGDAAECRRHITLARRTFARLDRRDHLEAPWLAGAEGAMRVDSAIGGALRDLAVATGDRSAARRAVEATARSCARLPPQMRSARLLLTLRLADSWACAGDPGAAVALASPVLKEAVRSRESMVTAELRGLHTRLAGTWGDLPDVREYRERLLSAGEGDAGSRLDLPDFDRR